MASADLLSPTCLTSPELFRTSEDPGTLGPGSGLEGPGQVTRPGEGYLDPALDLSNPGPLTKRLDPSLDLSSPGPLTKRLDPSLDLGSPETFRSCADPGPGVGLLDPGLDIGLDLSRLEEVDGTIPDTPIGEFL